MPIISIEIRKIINQKERCSVMRWSVIKTVKDANSVGDDEN